MRILVTGGAGFIGSNFVRYLLQKHPSYEIINLDTLTYAGNLENLKEVRKNPKYRFVKGDIMNGFLVGRLLRRVDVVVHFAAESHVDRSILDAQLFLKTNVLGTQVLLQAALESNIRRFVHISTDEVYGSLPEGSATETYPLRPNSPYAASKAGADLLVRSYHVTHQLPAVITRSSNNFGPYQYPEKVIPLFITNALGNQPLPLYGDGLQVRDWLYVLDHCEALDLVLHGGHPGEIYNIGGTYSCPNLELTKMILELMGKPESFIHPVSDRPGHDRRYALNCDKILRELGWKPRFSFETALKETIRWYQENTAWWKKLKQKKEFKKYYKKQYSKRREKEKVLISR